MEHHAETLLEMQSVRAATAAATELQEVQSVLAATTEVNGTLYSQTLALVNYVGTSCGFLPAIKQPALIELIPDIGAWLICAAGATTLLRYVLIRRPRTSASIVVAWFGWLLWQIIVVEGYNAIDKVRARGVKALLVTDEFANVLIRMARAWIYFFLPFLYDLSCWSAKVWSKMSPWQRASAVFIVVVCYVLALVYQAIRNHGSKMVRVLAQGSFLLAGPVVWRYSAQIPEEWLTPCINVLLKLLPTVVSLIALCWGELSRKPQRNRSWREWLTTSAEPPDQGNWRVTFRRLCLAFWACWPVLEFFRVAAVAVPHRVPNLQPEQRHILELQLQRAFITFLIWLEVWQGSLIVNRVLRFVLSQPGLWEACAWIIGARGLNIVMAIHTGAWQNLRPGRGFQFLRFVVQKMWMILAAGVALAMIIAVLVWMCYRAFRFAWMLTCLVIWLAASLDAAHTLAHNGADFYPKKLSFWVVAMLWEGLCFLPYAGWVFRWASLPFLIIAVFAGDSLLARAVFPVLRLMQNTWLFIFERCFCICCRGRGKAKEEEDEEPPHASGSVIVEDTGGAGSIEIPERMQSASAGRGNGGSTGEAPDSPWVVEGGGEGGGAGAGVGVEEEPSESQTPSPRRPGGQRRSKGGAKQQHRGPQDKDQRSGTGSASVAGRAKGRSKAD